MRALFLTFGGLLSAKVLGAWIASGHSVAALWVGPMDPRQFLRRDQALGLVAPSWSISALVRRYRIPVRGNPRLSRWSQVDAEISRLDADVLITSLTHQIVPATILERFDGRAVNFHPALLPHYRGPNPRSGMILDEMASLYGGVTLHVLSRDVDQGDVIGLRSVPYDPERGFIDWNVRQARAAGHLVDKELQGYLHGTVTPSPQVVGTGSYRKVQPSEIMLSGELAADRVKWLCDRLGASGWVRFRRSGSDGVKSHIVCRFLRRVGPRKFQAPRISRFAIDFDASDARVRVARRWFGTELRQLAMCLTAIARTRKVASIAST